MRVIREDKAKEIQAAKGGKFSAKFIRDFDLEWGEVREAAERIRGRQRRAAGKKHKGF